MKKNITGFTLVELIVVIMVLWILSTLWFISYSNYSWDARDAKRKADVGNLTKQLELRKIDGEDLFLFVLDDTSTVNTSIDISWYQTSAELGSNYKAWNADFVYLEIVWENFKDPLTGDSYKVWVTSYENRYEVAASIEQNGDHSSYVDGIWLPRTSNETQVEVSKIISDTVYLSWITKSDLILYAWDRVTIDSNPANIYEIKRTFHTKVIFDRPLVLTGSTMQLYRDESNHIIKNWNSDEPIEIWSGTYYTPYELSN
jgi:hypothetical protein